MQFLVLSSSTGVLYVICVSDTTTRWVQLASTLEKWLRWSFSFFSLFSSLFDFDFVFIFIIYTWLFQVIHLTFCLNVVAVSTNIRLDSSKNADVIQMKYKILQNWPETSKDSCFLWARILSTFWRYQNFVLSWFITWFMI